MLVLLVGYNLWSIMLIECVVYHRHKTVLFRVQICWWVNLEVLYVHEEGIIILLDITCSTCANIVNGSLFLPRTIPF